MSEHEHDREEPSVLPAREAMKLIGEKPEETDSPDDESAERPSDAADGPT